MGHFTTIYGYLESHVKYVERNVAVMDSFTFDEKYPLVNGFGRFVGHSQSPFKIASYATIVKFDTEEVWLDWIIRFEELFSQLDGCFAGFKFDSDNTPFIYERKYSAIGEERTIRETWVRCPSVHDAAAIPGVAGVINYMDEEDNWNLIWERSSRSQ